MGERIKVFMNSRYVRARGYSDYPGPEGNPAGKVRVEWVTRGVGGSVYTSKACTTLEEAVGLALAWLARQNRPYVSRQGSFTTVHEKSTVYVDTTECSETRFGYTIKES